MSNIGTFFTLYCLIGNKYIDFIFIRDIQSIPKGHEEYI